MNHDLEREIRGAIRHFWKTRELQAKNQGTRSGRRDQGGRSSVTGGAHLDGFRNLVRKTIIASGIEDAAVCWKADLELPGYYRAEKKWDLLVVVDGVLLATIEFKAQVGPSFGNNYNNRAEEALGNAADFWAAYREGAFGPAIKPWLGYLMLLEEDRKSTEPVAVREPHFPVFAEFREASYAKRYEILLTKLIRERLYDAACLLMSNKSAIKSGSYTEPSGELSFKNLMAGLVAKAVGYAKTRPT